MKRLAAVLLIATTALAACGQPAEQAATAPEVKPRLALNEGRLVLPAVKGNPAGGYFILVNGGDKPVKLAGVSVTGAGRSELHETIGETMSPLAQLEVKPGETVEFKPGGKHVMAFDLDPALTPGGTSEITLTFEGGDKLSAPLKLEARGQAAMDGMDHEGMDHSEHSN
ncbi:MAG: copper chaperone PCu(A)C [Brevundimonas sp.]|nr:copper chaperone PCu(A)C [Brevundimonas sp.]